MTNLVQDFVLATARRLPDQLALIEGAHRIAYGALARDVARLAAGLRARGVARGDRVVLFLPNGVELVTALLAVLEAGAVIVPVHPQTKAGKLAYLLRDTGARALFGPAGLRAIWRAALDEVTPGGPKGRFAIVIGEPAAAGADEVGFAELLGGEAPTGPIEPGSIDLDLAAIIYTSGTTGWPKGVMLSHRSMVSAARSVSAYLELRQEDVIACVLPMCFSYGLYQPLLAGEVGATVLIEAGFTFPVRVLEDMARERATVFPAVPAIYATLLSLPQLERYDLGSLRIMTNAAAALPVPQLQELRRRFPAVQFFSMYGQTECKRISYLDPAEVDRRPGSVGRGMPNQELFLLVPAAGPAAAGPAGDGARLHPCAGGGAATGQLVVRGSHVMMGYWQRPEETAAKLRDGFLPGEKLLLTGDVFRVDDEGYLHFVARQDDIIKSRGEKVSPREVENVLCEMPGVMMAAVLGVPDPLLGEAVKAFVVPAPGATLGEREVLRYCQSRLENYMVPKQIAFVASLPMTSSGKIDKRALAAGPDQGPAR